MSKALYQLIHEKFQLGPAYHMTHIQNLKEIMLAGELKSRNQMLGKTYLSLANEDVQAGRAAIIVNSSGKPLHDYVPLYLGFKTPMVAFNQDQNEGLLFLRFSLNMLSMGEVVISDGNARANNTQFKVYTTINDLSFLDIASIRTVKYAHDAEVKRKKQSEVLIPNKLLMTYMLDIICFSENAQSRTLAILNEFGIRTRVMVKPGWYFT